MILPASLTVCLLVLWQTPAFRLDVEAVLVDVSVLHRGEPVLSLAAADFELLDNGVRQQIELVNTESLPGLPLSVLLVLDTSSSMAGEKIGHLRVAAQVLLSGLEAKDQAALVAFSGHLQLRADWTSDGVLLRRAVDGLEAFGATALNDALFAGLMMTASLRRPMIVLFTDGDDTFSWLSEAQVLRTAEESSAVVYAVGLAAGQETEGGSKFEESPLLREAVEMTGGRLFYAAAARDLKSVFERILKEATGRYLLSYQPRGVAKEGWHQLEVKLKGRRGEVRARRGYYYDRAR